MQTIRDSISTIPGTISSILNYQISNPLSAAVISTATPAPPPPTSITSSTTTLYDNNNENLSTPSSISGDDSEKSHAIPNSLIKEQWQLVLGQDASIEELENAIVLCKKLVLDTNECSTERKWIVRHLVELRYRLNELHDFINDPKCTLTNSKIILGHHFVLRANRSLPIIPSTARQYCDHCSGIIWSVVQASYICSDCLFCVHHKCLQNVIRICAHIIASEKRQPNEDICPEIGLAMQSYKCAECHTPLNFKGAWTEPRVCDYSGLYYCPTCHWKDTCLIPSRIIHNWDFIPRKVCRSSLQELHLFMDRPVINLETINPKLFIYVENLSLVKKLRSNLNVMKKYLIECRTAKNEKLIDLHIGMKRHLIQSIDLYSISDLISIENGSIIDYLHKLYDLFDKHIRDCELCFGKGYICEICNNIEIIFPYDDGSIVCEKCKTLYHRACWTRKNMICPKCIRIEKRKKQYECELEDEKNGNNKKSVTENN